MSATNTDPQIHKRPTPTPTPTPISLSWFFCVGGFLCVATMATYGGSSETDPNPTKMAKFITSDGERVKVPVAIATMFGIVKAFVDGELDDPELENNAWPLTNVSSHVLDIVVYACKKLLELRLKDDAVEKERQEFDVEFFGQQSDETIVELVKAANYLEIEELLNFMMPSFRKRFGLGDDKGVEFVYTEEFEAILLKKQAIGHRDITVKKEK